MTSSYTDVKLLIGGAWADAADGRTLPVVNPATGERIGSVAHAGRADLDRALDAAQAGFAVWRKVSPYERAKVMRKAAGLLRERAEAIARTMTMEQGKPFAEAKGEVLSGGDVIEWFAEEGRRAYGRVIPGRAEGALQYSLKEPVGPVAAFTPWNFPVNQAVRKVSAALAAGCSVILKAPEETPGSPAELMRTFVDAGVPAGAVNLVYGNPAEISSYLIPHPVIRKVSFTGSTAVGKQLAAMAGLHMKRATMELGGHAPAMVFGDTDVDAAATALATLKLRNAGQVCVSPTRFLVQRGVYDRFVDRFATVAAATKVGDGLDAASRMGPLANGRRIDAMQSLIADAVERGATVRTGGKRIGNKGNFFEPTVLTGVTREMRIMNEEPFGPVALMVPFDDTAEALAEANRLPYGLAAFAYTHSTATAGAVTAGIESGMISFNGAALGLPEVPFGGIKDSGYGSEGGVEALEAYLNLKMVSQPGL